MEQVIDDSHTPSIDTHGQQWSEAASIALMLEHLRSFLGSHVNNTDLNILSFSLRYLFYSMDALYEGALPDLTDCTQRFPNSLPSDLLQRQHQAWLQLQTVKRLLERCEPLCQLLNSAIMSILESLDTGSSLLYHQNQVSYEQYRQSTTAQENWEAAFTLLTERLNDWQHTHQPRLSFTTQFADLSLTIPTLNIMDTAFDQILDNASMIYGDILPDFQAIAAGDDEAVATLLLDLGQKADHLLLDIRSLLKPLEALVRRYAINSKF